MTSIEIKNILEKQRTYFNSGVTIPVKYRVLMLKKLYSVIKKYEKEITNMLTLDLGKSDFEGFMCEVGLTLTEISYMIKNVKKFAKEKKVKTPLTQFCSVSYKKPVPYGNVLIMSPWNYPFLLTMEPLANAIASGNTVMIKPSAYSPNTSSIVKKIIEECFIPDYVAIVMGGRQENSALLEQKFDFVFFTGSQSVGKEVLRKTAENLTPSILELGGKSPCIVDDSANIKIAAKRIVFGKFLNLGQTCVAPDYILCHKNVKDFFLKAVIEEIKKQYGENPFANSDYGKIINDKHFDRLQKLICKEKLVYGGKVDKQTLQIEPTVLDNVLWTDNVMQEEIFGPIMPILTFDDINEVIALLQKKPKPLALYIFSENKTNIKKVTELVSYGGGCVNDTVIHLATSEMGFGGVGESGMGSYHGEVGFEAFSHIKSIVNKKTWIDLPMRYQPYNRKIYGKLLKIFLK